MRERERVRGATEDCGDRERNSNTVRQSETARKGNLQTCHVCPMSMEVSHGGWIVNKIYPLQMERYGNVGEV